jgi:hypothetical protein
MADANQAKVFATCEGCAAEVELTIEAVLTHGTYLEAFRLRLPCPRCRSAGLAVRIAEEDIDALIQQRSARIPILS